MDLKLDVIIDSPLNYSSSLTKTNLAKITQIIKCNHYLASKVDSWFATFQKWSQRNVSPQTDFMAALKMFLLIHPRFRADVRFSEDRHRIVASRIHCYIKSTRSSVTLAKAMQSLREDLTRKSEISVFPSSPMFMYMEQLVIIVPETVRNLACAAAAILVVTSLFLVNPLVVFLVLLSFASLIFELCGK